MSLCLSPSILLKPLKIQPEDDLSALRRAFSSCTPIPMVQNYPGGDVKAPPTGEVRVGWMDRTICILADLQGENLWTRATQLNDLLWLMGETFEIFLKFEGADQYLEFHIASNNCVLQLFFPDSNWRDEKYSEPAEKSIQKFMIKKPAFTSRVWKNEKGWTAFALIDLKVLQPDLPTLEGRELDFLFGRYHYPQKDEAPPVLTCSAALRQLDFHGRHDWGTFKCSSSAS